MKKKVKLRKMKSQITCLDSLIYARISPEAMKEGVHFEERGGVVVSRIILKRLLKN